MLLGIIERGRVHDIKLDMMAAELEVGAYQAGEFLLVLLSFQEAWHEAYVQQGTAALRLVQLAQ